MADAAYYREWRRTHPEYRKRQNLLRKEKRKLDSRGSRSQEYKKQAQRRLRASGSNGWCEESSLVRKAKQLALKIKRPDNRTYVYDDCYEDLVGVCLLAMCEGKDTSQAMHDWMKERRKNIRLWGPLYE